MIETTELRWFCEDALAAAMTAWFTQDGSVGAVEERCDVYRMDGRVDIGVKRRARTTLELKIRRSFGALAPAGARPHGIVEVWQKWSPADEFVSGGFERCAEVNKSVIKRRFSISGDEIAFSDATGSPGSVFCDVETVAVDDGCTEAWSFAFAAQGPRRSRPAVITAAWRTVMSVAPPDGWLPDGVVSCGYPEWLERRVGAALSSGQ